MFFCFFFRQTKQRRVKMCAQQKLFSLKTRRYCYKHKSQKDPSQCNAFFITTLLLFLNPFPAYTRPRCQNVEMGGWRMRQVTFFFFSVFSLKCNYRLSTPYQEYEFFKRKILQELIIGRSISLCKFIVKCKCDHIRKRFIPPVSKQSRKSCIHFSKLHTFLFLIMHSKLRIIF